MVTPTEIKSKYIKWSNRTITELGLKKSSAKVLPQGTLLLSSRATVGDVGIAVEECTTNQGFQSLIVNDNNSNEFFYNWIIMNKNEFIKRASGSTFLEISKKPSVNSNKEKVSILEDVDFELELIYKDEINVTYILKLLGLFKDNDNEEQKAKQKEDISNLLNNNPQLSKK